MWCKVELVDGGEPETKDTLHMWVAFNDDVVWEDFSGGPVVPVGNMQIFCGDPPREGQRDCLRPPAGSDGDPTH